MMFDPADQNEVLADMLYTDEEYWEYDRIPVCRVSQRPGHIQTGCIFIEDALTVHYDSVTHPEREGQKTYPSIRALIQDGWLYDPTCELPATARLKQETTP